MTAQQLSDQALETEQAALAPQDDMVIASAIEVIDGALAQMFQRELVSAGEVANLLLDVRSLLASGRS